MGSNIWANLERNFDIKFNVFRSLPESSESKNFVLFQKLRIFPLWAGQTKNTLKGHISTFTKSIALILPSIEFESYFRSSMYLQIEILRINMSLFGKLVNQVK